LLENKSKHIFIHCSSGYKYSLQKVLQDPAIQSQLIDTKFTRYLIITSDKVFYSWDHVRKAEKKRVLKCYFFQMNHLNIIKTQTNVKYK
ncbi:hypothetical protein C2G38_1969089, partial [Gigaspora rosea]